VALKGLLSGGGRKAKAAPKAQSLKALAAEVEALDAPASLAANNPARSNGVYQTGTWPVERQEILEKVFGRGNTQPGSHEFVADLMNSCALTSAKTMLDLKSGLGGADRYLVQKFGVWLVGLDQNEALVKEANVRSLKQDMEKKAIFHHCDAESLRLKPSGYDAILSRMFLSGISNKENAYEQLAQGLKPSGHLIVIDYVLGNPKGNEQYLDALMEKEVPSLLLCPAKHIANGLKKHNFMVHVAEDITEKFLHAAEEDWARYRDSLKDEEITPYQAQIILDECDRWDARAAAMKAGALKVYRFTANNSAEQKKGRVSTMSDWKY